MSPSSALSAQSGATQKVQADDDGLRLDQWLKSRFPQLGHGTVQKWLRRGAVRVNGRSGKNAQRVKAGEIIQLPRVAQTPTAAPHHKSSAARVDANFVRSLVLYKNNDWLVINKPAGLAVQGGRHIYRHLDAWLDALRFDAKQRPRLVHRLDKATSGVLVLARHRASAQKLTRAFARRHIAKLYWGLVRPVPSRMDGRLSMPLRKIHRASLPLMQVADAPSSEARPALTLYHVQATKSGYAFMVLQPITGRTHQLRAHSAAAGWPLIGDTKYGSSAPDLLGQGLHLHAQRIAVPRDDDTPLEVSAPLPAHMQASWKKLGLSEKTAGWLKAPQLG